MQSRIYRFRIVRALANAVFEAHDGDDEALMTLYEWTPDAERRQESLQRLEPMLETLHSEVFTVDASFYLAATTPAQGAEDLARLRGAGLFTGTWLNEAKAPAAPPPPPPLPPRVKPDEPVRAAEPALRLAGNKPGWSNGAVAGIVLVAAVSCIALGLGMMDAHDKQRALTRQVSDLNGRVDSLNGQVARAEQSKQAAVAEANQRTSALARQLQPFHGVHLFRIYNDCGHPLRIATRWLASNGQWIVQGWWSVGPGASVTPVASSNAGFYYYMEGRNKQGESREWRQNEGTPPMYLGVGGAFLYSEANPPSVTGLRAIHPDYVDQTSGDPLLPCS